MTTDPLPFACTHMPTAAEHTRDPGYRGCGAQAGEPCHWARRTDGLSDPAFHAERLEAAAEPQTLHQNLLHDQRHDLETETFREAVLDTGLV